MRVTLAKRIEQSWYSEGGFTLLLLPLSWLFALVVLLRRWCYRIGVFSAPELPLPVVVVGNLAVGGSGKSPVVSWLVTELMRVGYQPGIVSRGYGGQPQNQPLLVTADSDPEQCGDEPVMLAEQTGVPVCVCVDRVAAVRCLHGRNVDVVIADDGLQHYRMRRVAEVLVVDGERFYGNGQLLPAGPLREPLARRAEADAELINGGAEAGHGFVLRPAAARLLSGGGQRVLSEFSGQRVWAVSGIGNPARFTALLSAFGIQTDQVDVADHARVSLEELRARRRQPILMTHKDAVKYRQEDTADVWFVPVEVAMEDQQAQVLLDRVISKIKNNAGA